MNASVRVAGWAMLGFAIARLTRVHYRHVATAAAIEMPTIIAKRI